MSDAPRGPRAGLLLIAPAAALTALALLAGGCGSEEGFPPPVEPATSPKPATEPAGRVIDLPGEAEGVAADPETGIVGVSVRDPDKLLLIEDPLAPGKPRITEVGVPESARHMELARPGGPLLTTAEYTDDLLEVSLPGGEIKTVKVGDFPHAVTADPGSDRIFVGDEGGDTISVVEGDAVTQTLPAPEQPGGLAVAGGSLGTVAVAERVLQTWDAETLQPTGEVEAGVGPSHMLAGPDERFYVADTGGDAILVFEPGPEPRLLDRANVPGSPYGIAIDERRGMLWVTQTARNRVVGFELTDLAPKRVVSYPTVQQPNTVAVDSKRGIVYVAGRTPGQLQAIDTRTEQGDG